MRKTILTFLVTVLVLPALFSGAKSAVAAGSLIKGESFSSVYYLASDGKRYVFPNERVFKTWYPDFSSLVSISDSQLFSTPIGGNVTYRPGARLVKIQTDPKVYAVDQGGMLRWVASEAIAEELYGSNWNKKVDDIPDVFFVNYTVGSPIFSALDFNPVNLLSSVTDIFQDRGHVLGASTSAETPGNDAVIDNLPILPVITKFQADTDIVNWGEEIIFEWDSENAVTCAFTTTRDISIPFTGRLPQGEATVSISKTEYDASPEFKYYLICADPLWFTAVQEIVLTKDRTPILFSDGPSFEVSFDEKRIYQQAQLNYASNKTLTTILEVSPNGEVAPGISNQQEGLLVGLLPATEYIVSVLFTDEAGNSAQRTLRFTTEEIAFPYAIRNWQDAWYDRHEVPTEDRCYTTGDLCTSDQWKLALGVT